MTIFYVCIGNSDDKLTQAEWAAFVDDVESTLENFGHLHGSWFARPDVQWQSACWCIETEYDLQPPLSVLTKRYRQNSIALARAETVLVTAEANPA